MDIIESRDYQLIIQEQVYDIIDYLLAKDQEFSITANIDSALFEPELPESIFKNFSQFTMFTLSNYTYSTIELTQDTISFEAGFGAENFGSVVTVPLNGVFQIIIDESILYLNPTATIDKIFTDPLVDENTDQQMRSKNAFMKNNKNLFS